MKAAIVKGAGQIPVYGDIEEPVAAANETRIRVTASALSNLAKGRASGQHYSSVSRFPFVVGVDGVGRRDDGRRVYFALPNPPNGGMAEWTVVPSDQCVTIPDEIDDITAAAIANPGMSSWAAYQERAHLKAGETVLINGGTGTAGRLAVRIARYLGAKKVIATGRHQEALNEVGADATILLQEDASALEASFKAQFDAGIDVVIDYLWGASAVCILRAAAKVGPRSPLRFVQIGSTTGGDITLPSSVLRSIPIEITGSGLGSVSSPRLVHVIGELLRAAATEGFTLATSTVPLSEVEQAWNRGDKAGRIVFTMNGAH